MKKLILTLGLLFLIVIASPAQQVRMDTVKAPAPANSLKTKPKPKRKHRAHHTTSRWSRMSRQLYQARIHEAANKKAQAIQDEYARRHAADTARY